MASGPEEKIKAARELCEKSRVAGPVEISPGTGTRKIREMQRPLFYRGAALAATGRFVEAETFIASHWELTRQISRRGQSCRGSCSIR